MNTLLAHPDLACKMGKCGRDRMEALAKVRSLMFHGRALPACRETPSTAWVKRYSGEPSDLGLPKARQGEGLSALTAWRLCCHAAGMKLGRASFRHRPEAVSRFAVGSRPPSPPRSALPAPRSNEKAAVTSETAIVSLDETVAALEPYLRDRIIPTGMVINPLLDVWGAAQSMDASVARPIEELLTVLVSRSATTPGELVAALDEVRVGALQARLLSNA
jgi:hypothetical protein